MRLPVNRSASGTDLTYGLGLKYNLTKQTSLRVEWEQFKDVGNEFHLQAAQDRVRRTSI